MASTGTSKQPIRATTDYTDHTDEFEPNTSISVILSAAKDP